MDQLDNSDTPFADAVVDLLSDAAGRVIAGDAAGARLLIAEIDADALESERRASHERVRGLKAAGIAVPREKRPPRPTGRRCLRVFEQDRYVCRYCRRRCVDLNVLHLLSRAVPDVFGDHPHWKQPPTHPVYWIHAANLEHVVPWWSDTTGGEDNWVTACSLCQYAKKNLDLDALGWRVGRSAASSWDGLRGLLPALDLAVRRMGR
jgi:5-methylcytosine-specific restriction endonuclease McrA